MKIPSETQGSGSGCERSFNWKLVVAIYLLLEACVVSLLKPRVYKRQQDVVIETNARMFLVAVLMIGIYSDSLLNVANGPGPLGAVKHP